MEETILFDEEIHPEIGCGFQLYGSGAGHGYGYGFWSPRMLSSYMGGGHGSGFWIRAKNACGDGLEFGDTAGAGFHDHDWDENDDYDDVDCND